ncbi:2-phospho-L-lactate transferase [Variovorax sp. OV700]|uniref:2-phospho-L-lactate transferase n=1 Tax=Variovorax sp. OV700 TaxID=1882826 RepID=UPI000B81BB43|nr:2-phospho-L-lactate transferase [Variovorax sp. OV700]
MSDSLSKSSTNRSVVLLAGGVGGAKMAEGLAGLENVDLTVIGNVADDDEFHGLWVSPDIDTLTYSLSGRINRQQGWGVADEALRGLSVLKELGEETWMTLGDRDLGLHIYRSSRLRKGHARQAIADDISRAFGACCRIVLSTEDVVQTRVKTEAGWLSFQEYFVREHCAPEVLELSYQGLDVAAPNPAALDAIANADVIVIAPSNPLVSIEPILSIAGMRTAIAGAKAARIAVCPFVNGKAIKGPADRMMVSLGFEATVGAVARRYAGIADTLLIDTSDRAFCGDVKSAGLCAVACNIVMTSLEDKVALARTVLATALSAEACGVVP